MHVAHTSGLLAAQGMPRHVDDGGGEVLGRRKALAELAGGGDGVDKFGREGFPGVDVAGIVAKNRRVERPVFVDLGGEFHVVAGHVGAREGGVPHVGQQAVECVPKLVEHGGHFVEGEQCGAAVGGFGHAHDVDDHRPQPQQPRLLHKPRHPGPAAFRRPRVVVRQEQPDAGTVCLLYLPNVYIRRVSRQVRARFHADAVEALSRVEHAVAQHAIQREVAAQLLGIEGVVTLPEL